MNKDPLLMDLQLIHNLLSTLDFKRSISFPCQKNNNFLRSPSNLLPLKARPPNLKETKKPTKRRQQVSRVLRTKGVFLVISYGGPATRLVTWQILAALGRFGLVWLVWLSDEVVARAREMCVKIGIFLVLSPKRLRA